MSQPTAVAYQDDCGDYYCPNHAHDDDQPRTADDLRAAAIRLRRAFGPDARPPHCDFCGTRLDA